MSLENQCELKEFQKKVCRDLVLMMIDIFKVDLHVHLQKLQVNFQETDQVMLKIGQSHRVCVNKVHFLTVLMQSHASISIRLAARPQPGNDSTRKQQLLKGFKDQRRPATQSQQRLMGALKAPATKQWLGAERSVLGRQTLGFCALKGPTNWCQKRSVGWKTVENVF